MTTTLSTNNLLLSSPLLSSKANHSLFLSLRPRLRPHTKKPAPRLSISTGRRQVRSLVSASFVVGSMVQQQEEEAALKPPLPAPAAVVFAWDPAAVTKKPAAAAGARVVDSKQPQPGSPSPKKPAPLARLLSVPPPPGRAVAARSMSSRARAVRPEDDPFLAAYLACTKSARNENAKKGRSSRRFTWAALGLSCKSSSGAVEQSMVKVAKRPELDPRDA